MPRNEVIIFKHKVLPGIKNAQKAFSFSQSGYPKISEGDLTLSLEYETLRLVFSLRYDPVRDNNYIEVLEEETYSMGAPRQYNLANLPLDCKKKEVEKVIKTFVNNYLEQQRRLQRPYSV